MLKRLIAFGGLLLSLSFLTGCGDDSASDTEKKKEENVEMESVQLTNAALRNMPTVRVIIELQSNSQKKGDVNNVMRNTGTNESIVFSEPQSIYSWQTAERDYSNCQGVIPKGQWNTLGAYDKNGKYFFTSFMNEAQAERMIDETYRDTISLGRSFGFVNCPG